MGLLLDLVGRQHRGQRQPGAERLRQREDVGHDPVALEGEHRAGAAEPGLGLVEHQQHAALVAARLQRGEVAGRQVEDAARRQHRLGDERRQRAGALAIDQVERVVELGAPVERAVGVGEPRPVGVRARTPPSNRPAPGRGRAGRPSTSPPPRRRSCRASSGRTRRPPSRRSPSSPSAARPRSTRRRWSAAAPWSDRAPDPPSVSARSITGRDSIPEKRWSSRPIISVTTSTISGCECPRIALIWPLVKSSTRRPAASSTNAPAARSATNGENVAPYRTR